MPNGFAGGKMVKIVNSQLGIITDSVNSFFDNIFGRAQEYENLLISSGGIAFLRMIITGMFLGFLISAVVMMYNKRVLGKAVRELVELGAVGSENAVAMTSLACSSNAFIRRSVLRGVNLRRVIKVMPASDSECQDIKKITSESALVYIPEQDLDAACRKFDKSGTSIRSLLLVIAISLAIYIVVMFFIPLALSLINGVVGNFGK